MAFRTKLDFSSNRQVKQRIETFTSLSGGTSFGVPFSVLPTGPDLTTLGITFSSTTLLSTFSGNSTSSVYTWYYPQMNLGINGLSAITPTNSGITQNTSAFTATSYTTIDGNTVATAYSGVSFDITPIAVYSLGGGNYSGSVQTNVLEFLSAGTIDFTGRTIWADVSGITRTNDLIITRTPVIGATWTCIDSEGKGSWIPASASTSGLWVAGTGLDSVMMNNGNNISSNHLSVAEGSNNQALGAESHAEGSDTIAQGHQSHSEGNSTWAYGHYSHAENLQNKAMGVASHAEGNFTESIGEGSHAEGISNTSGLYLAFGVYISGGTNASKFELSEFHGDISSLFPIGDTIYIDDSNANKNFNIDISQTVYSSVFTNFGSYSATVITLAGTFTYPSDSGTIYISNLSTLIYTGFPYTVIYDSMHTEGLTTLAVGRASHAEGGYTIAGNNFSHAEGNLTIASGFASHAEGHQGFASGPYSHAEGDYTKAKGWSSHAEGSITIASGDYSHAEGWSTIASNYGAHAEGGHYFLSLTGGTASGPASHAEGILTLASGYYSHAENQNTKATGTASHAEGSGTTASGTYSHAEGFGSKASGDTSHAEGVRTVATGTASHAQGWQCSATTGTGAHAEGYNTIASNVAAHAQGVNTIASGNTSHAMGQACIAGANNTFAGGQDSGTYAHNSFVFGSGSLILSAATYSNVLGRNITGTTQDTTYVDYLNVKRVLATASANDIRIDANGNLTTNVSDERLKENITPLIGSLNKVKALQGVTYQWKDRNAGTDAIKLGFIAQQVESVEPLLVFTNKDENEYKGLHIDGIIPLLVESVKDLDNAITSNDSTQNKITIPTYTPSGSTDTNGNLGNVTMDDDYLYIRTSTGWKRTNLESF